MSIRKDSVGIVLTELTNIGRKRIKQSPKGEELIKLLGDDYGFTVGIKTSGHEALAAIREQLLDRVDQFGEDASRAAMEVIADMGNSESAVMDKTPLEVYDTLSPDAKRGWWAIVGLIILSTVSINLSVWLSETPNVEMQFIAVLIPCLTLVAACAVPIKAILPGMIGLGTKLAKLRFSKK